MNAFDQRLASKGLTSPNELARVVLTTWAFEGETKGGRKPDVRSLGNALRAVGAGDVAYVRSRPRLAAAVADALGFPSGDAFVEWVGAEHAASIERPGVGIPDLGERARFLADRHTLPPGLPPLVGQPSAWADAEVRRWWVFGRDWELRVVTAWLVSGGHAEVIEASDEDRVRRAVLAGRRVLVVVRTAAQEALLRALAPTSILAAAPWSPPAAAGAFWTRLAAPPTEAWFGDCVRWVESVTGGRGGDLDDLARDMAVLDDLASPGDLVTFVALARSIPGLAAAAPTKVFRELVRLRRPGGPDIDRVGELLVALVSEFLLRDEVGLDEAAWASVVPSTFAPDVDLGALRRLVDASGPAVSAAQLRKILAPGPVAVISWLRDLEVLDEVEPDRFAPGPAWLVNRVAPDLVGELLDGGLASWRRAAVQPVLVPALIARMVERIHGGDFGSIEAASGVVDANDPRAVAAAEVAYVATGLAVLGGASVPVGVVRAIWEAQARVAAPRLLTDVAPWDVARVALAEALGEEPVFADAQALTAAYLAVRFMNVPYWRETYALADRIASRLRPWSVESALLVPSWIVAAVKYGRTLPFDIVRFCQFTAPPVPPLREVARLQGIEPDAVLGALWRTWRGGDSPDITRFAEDRGAWWRTIPGEVLATEHGRNLLGWSTLDTSGWNESQWRAALDTVSGAPPSDDRWLHLLREAPFDRVLGVLAACGGLSHRAATLLWHRHGDRVLSLVFRLDGRGLPAWGPAVIHSAPAEATERVVERLTSPSVGSWTDEARSVVGAWCSERVRGRVVGWMAAWRLLTSLERPG